MNNNVQRNRLGDSVRLFLQNQVIAISGNKKVIKSVTRKEDVGMRLMSLVAATFDMVNARLRGAFSLQGAARECESGMLAETGALLCNCMSKAHPVAWCDAFFVADIHISIYTLLSNDVRGELSVDVWRVMLDAVMRLWRVPALSSVGHEADCLSVNFTAIDPLASLIFYLAVERHFPDRGVRDFASKVFTFCIVHFLHGDKSNQKELELAFRKKALHGIKSSFLFGNTEKEQLVTEVRGLGVQ